MEPALKRPTIFSGMQPTGHLHLGNYLGAMRNWGPLQESHDCIYCVVDMHSITTRQDPSTLRRHCLDLMAYYLAAGIDPARSVLMMQSHVSAHAELAWILNCYTYFGELSRMTQFKDKSQQHADNINAGLFTYPALMAADILLYQADLVPVGEDQKQHVELTRDIAQRANNLWGDVFTIPDAYIPKAGARIMSLGDPTRKMSKSDPDTNGVIYLSDAPDVCVRKIKRAVTDTGSDIIAAPDKPGVSNLLNIYCACTGATLDAAQATFAGKGYGAFKEGVAEAVVGALSPLQSEYARIRADKAYLQKVMQTGAQAAQRIAARTLDKVRRKVGLAAYKI